jgi:hypothetical protein
MDRLSLQPDTERPIMNKRIMLLALAVVSTALFALPAVAVAQEIHSEPGEAFSITGGGGEFKAESEPTITCEKTDGSGKFDAGSTTTGSLELDFTGCHTTVFGITAKCRSEGSALDNTIKTSGSFHLTILIINLNRFSATLITISTTKLVCAGISTMTTTGSVIGTVTSPKCGESSKTMTTSFTATGTVQNHLSYTGATYDLKAYTGTESANEKTAALVGTTTATSINAQKLNCT